MNSKINTEWLAHAVEAMAETAVKDGEYWRPTYSEQDARGVAQLREYFEQAGLAVSFDTVGNLHGVLAGQSAETVMVGSHRDTVRHGGKYDGILGVLTAIEAVRSLYDELGTPQKTVRVVALCEEESSRFPINYLGSRYLCGELTEEELCKTDRAGVAAIDAIRAAGYAGTPLSQRPPLPQRFVELHIEQGGVLESAGEQIGIVTDIVGWYQGEVLFTGRQNHAGTTPMNLRLDPVPVACKFISRLNTWAVERTGKLVCTVGRIETLPGNVNVIPASVRISLDIRSADKSHIAEAKAKVAELAQQLSGGVGIELSTLHDQDPVPLDAGGADLLEEVVGGLGLRYRRMVSGAGHDSQVLARHIPVNMLFIPSAGGISHSTAEYSSPEDIAAGCAVLREYLRRLAW